jgi:hypothetical protein
LCPRNYVDGNQSLLLTGAVGYSDGNLGFAGNARGNIAGVSFNRSGSFTIDNVGTRAMGLVQAVGGAAEVFGGGALATAGVHGEPVTFGASTVAVVSGGAVAVMGADNVQAGLRTAFTGQNTNTYGARLISSATGMSLDRAELTYGVVQIGTGVGAASGSRALAAREIVAGGAGLTADSLTSAAAEFRGHNTN